MAKARARLSSSVMRPGYRLPQSKTPAPVARRVDRRRDVKTFAPHASQNFAVGFSSVPHALQNFRFVSIRAPQSVQNFALGVGTWHVGHGIIASAEICVGGTGTAGTSIVRTGAHDGDGDGRLDR